MPAPWRYAPIVVSCDLLPVAVLALVSASLDPGASSPAAQLQDPASVAAAAEAAPLLLQYVLCCVSCGPLSINDICESACLLIVIIRYLEGIALVL